MIFNESEMINNIKRRFTNEDFSSGFYFIWFMLTLVVFGFFGIIPAFSKLNAKINTVHEMQSLNNSLSQKMSEIKTISSELNEAQKYTPYLDVYLPTEFGAQSYLVDAVLAVSKSGFDLSSFSTVDSAPGSLGLTLQLEGSGNPVSVLKNLEDLKRITQINQVRYNFTKDAEETSIDLNIYSTESY